MVLNGLAISDATIDELTEHMNDINEMADDVASDKMAKHVLNELESAY
jgi:hypothetical protein